MSPLEMPPFIAYLCTIVAVYVAFRGVCREQDDGLVLTTKDLPKRSGPFALFTQALAMATVKLNHSWYVPCAVIEPACSVQERRS